MDNKKDKDSKKKISLSKIFEHEYSIFQDDLSDYEYNEVMAQLAGISMCAWETGRNSIDENGADFGDLFDYDC